VVRAEGEEESPLAPSWEGEWLRPCLRQGDPHLGPRGKGEGKLFSPPLEEREAFNRRRETPLLFLNGERETVRGKEEKNSFYLRKKNEKREKKKKQIILEELKKKKEKLSQREASAFTCL